MRTPILVALVLGVLAATGCGGGDDPPTLPEGKFLAARQMVTPRVHLFAEPILARVDVIVDAERFDPDRLRLVPSFDPYEEQGDPVVKRRDAGRYTHLSYEYTLRCLVYECLEEVNGGPPQIQAGGIPPPPSAQAGGFGERSTTRFDAARVVYDDPKDGERTIQNVTWPEVQSVSRLNYGAGASGTGVPGSVGVGGVGFPFEASVTPLPEASYRISPNLLGAGLLVGALALLALPAALVVRTLRREDEVVVEEAPELPPLEKALALVEWARDRSEPERREALEALARELDDQQSPLSWDAQRLAWSSAAPLPEAMRELVELVRESHADTP
jgi:hypothetical protein